MGAFLVLAAITLAGRVWFHNFEWMGRLRIDVALLFLPYFAIARGATFGMVAGFLLGVLVDATNPQWMGASTLGYVVVGFFAGSFGQTIYVDRTRAQAIVVAGSVIIFDAIYGLLTVGFASPIGQRISYSLGSALLTGVAAAFLSWSRKFLRARTRAGHEAALDA